MVRTVRQTLIRSQLACNEIQTSARTCGRRAADSMIKNVGLSQYILIIHHRVIQLTTISFWVPETRLRLSRVKNFKKILPNRVKNPATPSSIFIFVSSSSTGELCSQPIRGNLRQIGRMFPERVERSFLDPEYSFDEYFQLGSRKKLAQLRTN